MFRRRDEDDYEFPIQSVNKNFANSAPAATNQGSAQSSTPNPTPAPAQSGGYNPYNPAATAAANAQAAQNQAAQNQAAQNQAAATARANEASKAELSKPAEANQTNNVNKETPLKPVNQNQASPSLGQPAKPATTQAPAATNSIFTPKPASTPISVAAQPAASAASQPAQIAPTLSFKPAGSAPAAASNFNVETERRLTVGYGISLEGKVSNCDKLVIYGNVNAELNNVKALQISESGHFRGAAEVEQAEISGTFEGDLRVRKNILINTSGRVNGKITYGSIEIKPGGKFTGEIVEDTDLQENASSDSSAAQDLDIFSNSGVDKAA